MRLEFGLPIACQHQDDGIACTAAGEGQAVVHGFATPAPLKPGQTYAFGWSLPNVNHVFLPGHRIMVQIQSSLYPLYDRNPQTWVPSIFDAPANAYKKARQTVRWGGAEASAIYLPMAQD